MQGSLYLTSTHQHITDQASNHSKGACVPAAWNPEPILEPAQSIQTEADDVF